MLYALSDTATMVRRSLRHATRALDSLLLGVLLPVFILLLFVYVFGGAIATDTPYLNYVVPGIIVLCAGYGAAGTAVVVAADMTNGVIDRFRALPIHSSAVLTGHVTASLARNLVSTALVLGVAFALGFRPTGGLAGWLGVLAVLTLFILAMSWLSVCFGLVASTVDGASAFGFFVLFLPYVSSAFVPVDTMPAGLRAVAEHQPVTPVVESLRALVMGQPVGGDVWLTVAWFGTLLAGSYLLAGRLFRRRSAR